MTRSAPSGFTLIELMAVLAVIAIMTALVIPELRGTMSDAVLRSSARTLIDACQLANSRAITENRTQHLKVEPPTGRYALVSPDDATESGVRPDRSPLEGQIDPRVSIEVEAGASETGRSDPSSPAKLPETPPANAARNRISFYPDGTADRSTIVLRDREGFRLALQVQPLTSRVRLIELPRQ